MLESDEVKNLIVEVLDINKAEDIVSIQLSEERALADYMIIASGTSSRHVSGLAKNLQEKLHKKDIKDIKTEGLAKCDWVVVDVGDVIVHLFRPEVREFYNIEEMWSYQPQHINA
ncbi:MAG: ribosome silencing factor [Alphaproteobacteria bacterium]|nr:ribosome silencing factor [Alphaproteobacteria bacterium]